MDKDVHIGKEVLVFSNRIKRRISEEASQYGVTSIQSRILGFIHNNLDKRDIFQKDIEEEFDIRRSSVTSVLQLMEKNGYIKRVSVAEDGRLKKIVITEKGLEIDRKVHDYITKFEQSLRDELSEEEVDILISLIDKLSRKIAD